MACCDICGAVIMNISVNPRTTDNEKAAGAENAALFTKKLPFYFPDIPITRKMHLMHGVCNLSPNCHRQNSKYLLQIPQIGGNGGEIACHLESSSQNQIF